MNIFEYISTWVGFREFAFALLVFLPLERLRPLRKEQRILRNEWQTDLIYVFLNGFFIRVGLALVILGAVLGVQQFIPPFVQHAVSGQPYWLQTVEAIVIADLGFYSAHRLFHAIPTLWRFHAIHHSIEDLDWLAAARVHPADQILTKAASIVPLVALGFSELAIVIYSTIYFWHSLLLHANVRIRIGPLHYVIASPAFHHWHHANDRAAYNVNFAAQLSLLDKLFGTLYLPADRMPERYGVDEHIPRGYVKQLLHPLVSLAGNAFAAGADRGAPSRNEGGATTPITRERDA